MGKFIDLVGQKYNRLMVIERASDHIFPSGNKNICWKCKCECGNEVVVTASHLRSGHTKSCGCYSREMSKCKEVKHRKHGLTFEVGRKPTRLYRIWSQMKTRCFNLNDEHFKDYGGRGITVCDEWKDDFQAFHDWAVANGYADGLTIDRINVNGNYEPSNCRWATAKEQNSNRRNTPVVTFEGITKTLLEWSEITGVGYQTLYYRYRAGKTPSEILKV